MQRKFRPRKKVVAYFSDNSKPLDYKDVNTLKKFISERGKILPRRVTMSLRLIRLKCRPKLY